MRLYFFSCFLYVSCLNKPLKAPNQTKSKFLSLKEKIRTLPLWSSLTLGIGSFIFYWTARRGNMLRTPPFFAWNVVFSYTDFLKSRMLFHPSVECGTFIPSFNIYWVPALYQQWTGWGTQWANGQNGHALCPCGACSLVKDDKVITQMKLQLAREKYMIW